MIIHNVMQGSEQWHLLRASVDGTASEAPAMMGASKYQSRDDLIKTKATGIVREINSFTQSLFDDGHRTEASIRPYIESLIDEELYPITGTLSIEGLLLLASFDGLTMMEDAGFEHKLWNEALAASVIANDLDPHYYWQLEQQLLISKAEFILFAVSNGTKEKCVWMKYYPVPGRAQQLIAGWKQFKIDVANYVLPEAEAPKAVAEPVESLPAIRYDIDLTKGIAIHSNLDVFKAAAERLVEKSKEELVTDQDFANAAARVKECEKAEKNIDSLIDRVLGDLGDADKFKRDMESIKEFIRQSRLNQSKKITQRNETRKIEILTEGKTKLAEHIKALNEKLAPLTLPPIFAKFAEAIKGKSKFENMISAVNDVLATAKIEADATYVKIGVNVDLLNDIAAEHMFLFPDLQTICINDAEHFKAVAVLRIAEHEKEQQRLAEVKRLADEKAERDRAAAETKRLADEQLAKDNAAATQHKAQEVVTTAEPAKRFGGGRSYTPPAPQELPQVVPIASAEEYDEMAAISDPKFNESFMEVFAEDAQEASQEAFVDMSDFHAGLISGFEQSIRKFDDCLRTGQDFKEAMHNLIAAKKIPAKAA